MHIQWTLHFLCCSDTVEHEVLPSLSERLAVTFWASAASSSSLERPLSITLSASVSVSVPAAADHIQSAGQAVTVDSTKTSTPRPLFNRIDTSPPLRFPLDAALQEMQNNKSIFIAIASYRDSECQHTIRDLYLRAKFPDRLFVGVVWQCDRQEDANCFEFYGGAATADAVEATWWMSHVRTVEMHWSQAKGPCWARHIAGSLWQVSNNV